MNRQRHGDHVTVTGSGRPVRFLLRRISPGYYIVSVRGKLRGHVSGRCGRWCGFSPLLEMNEHGQRQTRACGTVVEAARALLREVCR
jgi:hypothetical protein